MEKTKPKRIVLCSDGTGNRGGTGNDSNVFSLYKAIEVNNPPGEEQFVFYDNGVGTSGNKYVRAVSGAFGFGFRQNVRDLYEYLATHYDPDAKIFVFGFSRGAATVRAFIGMVQVCGLVNRENLTDNEVQDRIDEALKIYEKNDPGTDDPPPGADQFKARDDVLADVKFHFLGVWDTVSALGFPVDWSYALTILFESLDWLSDFIWPHRFYSYRLNQNVATIRHALAVDDERTTFHPKVWNETRKNACQDIEQVWFAGTHSNVGGGYPRFGLSNVALHWMMCWAARHGLRFKPGTIDDLSHHADVHDKLFDSRDGLGIYYRYQPRNIAKLCENRMKGGNVSIHHTVFDRMEYKTADYAPGHIPYNYHIVSTPSPDITEKVSEPVRPKSDPAGKMRDQWNKVRTNIDKQVEKRRRLHRVFVELSLLLVVIAFYFWVYPENIPKSEGLNDGLISTVLTHITEIGHYLVPEFFEGMVTYLVTARPYVGVAVILLAFGLIQLRKKWKQRVEEASKELRVLALECVKKLPKPS